MMDVDIRAARSAEAGHLTSIAFEAKRYWGYPEDWMKLWEDELTVLPDYVERNWVYLATSGDRPSVPAGRRLPLLVADVAPHCR